MAVIPYSTHTTFDDTSFESQGVIVERIHEDLPEMREEMEALPGRHGSRVLSLSIAPREIRLECRLMLDRWQDFDDAMADMARWLVTSDDRRLCLRTHPDQYYLAHYKSMVEGERIGGTGIGAFEVTFTAADPMRYGEVRSLVVTEQEWKRFDVGGTEVPDATIEVRNARRPGPAGKFGMTIANDQFWVSLPDDSAHSLSIDLTARTILLDGKAAGMTLDSNWPTLRPGRAIARVSEGRGTATISWIQRYR